MTGPGPVRLPHRPPGGREHHGELISILWEGRLDTPGVRGQRGLITDLRTTLQALGQEAVIIKRRDLIAVDPKQVDCDYYRFLAGDRSPGNLFRGST